MKKDYLVLLIQLDGNLASDVLRECPDSLRTTRASSRNDTHTQPILSVHFQVLCIGGGDGGLPREVSKHSMVSEIHVCEVDKVQTCTYINDQYAHD